MNWMYQNPTSVDPEEYLLGRTIDKKFFKKSSPENHMRSIKNESASLNNHIDLSRKILEDPLTAIKEKEIEERKLLFQKLQLKRNETIKMVPAYHTEIEENSSKSLEQLIIENIKKLPFDIDIKKLYDAVKGKKKLKKKKNEKESFRKQRSYQSSEEDSTSTYEDSKSAKHKRDRNSKTKLKIKSDSKHKIIRNKRSDDSDSTYDDVKLQEFNSSSENSIRIKKSKYIDKSRKRKKSSSEELDLNCKNSKYKKQNEYFRADDKYGIRSSELEGKKKVQYFRKHNARHSHEQECQQKRREKEYFSDTKKYRADDTKKRNQSPENYREKGHEKFKISKHEINEHYLDKKKYVEKSLIRSKYHRNSPERSKEKFNSLKRASLTEEEKEAKRREMMENAIQCDIERKKNVKRYEIEDEKETKKNKKFDKDFTRNQLSALMESENSVENRIKSNVRNIQRNSRDMDRNFARRY